MLGPEQPEKHHELLPPPSGAAEPPCDCAGPPPPQFLLPPPPVDPAWAAADTDLCDIVAPYQTCHALTGGHEGGEDTSSALTVLVAVLTASVLLLIVLLTAVVFFCRCRRRSPRLMTCKNSTKRTDASRTLYDGLPARAQVIPSSLRTNGHTAHIEMVSVKGGQCGQLMPGGGGGGGGGLFVYPPPPSLTDDGSERTSNMYEEIPCYGRLPSHAPYGSDSEDDVSRPSDDDLRAQRRHCAYTPVTTDDPSDLRYVQTMPSGGGRPPAAPRDPHRRPRSVDRRRPSPASALQGPARAKPVRRDASQSRRDPYYYSDILARQASDVISPSSDVSGAYRRPYDEERPVGGRGLPVYCQPEPPTEEPHLSADAFLYPPSRQSGLRSPSIGYSDRSVARSPSAVSHDRISGVRSPHDRSRDRSDCRSPPNHTSPLADRMALDPFVDVHPGDLSRVPRNKLSSFRGPGTDGFQEQELGDPRDMGVPRSAGLETEQLRRSHREPRWNY